MRGSNERVQHIATLRLRLWACTGRFTYAPLLLMMLLRLWLLLQVRYQMLPLQIELALCRHVSESLLERVGSDQRLMVSRRWLPADPSRWLFSRP